MQRGEVPEVSRHARQLVVAEVQPLQREEPPERRRHAIARQPVRGEVQPRQRGKPPELCRHARELVRVEVQDFQRGEVP